MSDTLDVKEFIAGFLAEAEELLASSNRNLLAIESADRRGEHDPRAVRDTFRSIHTLKGLAAMVGADPIVNVAHEMETLLRKADRAAGKLPLEAVDLILKGVRAIEERLASLARGETVPAAPSALVESLASLTLEAAPGGASAVLDLEPRLLSKLSITEQEQLLLAFSKGKRALRLDFVPSSEKAGQGLNITSVRQRLGAIAEIVKVVPRTLPTAGVAFVLLIVTEASNESLAAAVGVESSEVQEISRTPKTVEPEASLVNEPLEEEFQPQRQNFIRVDIRRLDDALDHLSSLVIIRSRLQRVAERLLRGEGAVRDLTGVVGETTREIRNLRGAIMRARMVSVAELLERAPLIVRGLSRSLGKQVAVTIDAGDTELDKAVADRLFPAIVHLLRNAVDHGLESPAERGRAGKSAEGRLRVTCVEHAGNQLELVITDDGRGVDRGAIARRAGVEVPETNEELLALIARPGLSSRDQATETSGRGMGMDIVKRVVVDDLGGHLQLSPGPEGIGTSFTLRVPLVISIVEALSFRCGGELFVAPVSAIDDLAEIPLGSTVHTPAPPHATASATPAVRLLQHRGSTVPLFQLSALLGLASTKAARPKAIIVRRDSQLLAFEVDEMVGKQEIVVRPLHDPLTQTDTISGSTDLGDGNPTLVLDLMALCQSVSAIAPGDRQ